LQSKKIVNIKILVKKHLKKKDFFLEEEPVEIRTRVLAAGILRNTETKQMLEC
jgi:hypothetical protein